MKTAKEIKHDLEEAWSGLSYAERVEKNNMLIAYKVKEQIIQSARKNESIAELSARLNNLEAKSGRMIGLLTETEMNRANYIAFKDVVTQAGIEKIEYHTSGSARTCVECSANEGKIFTVGDEIELPLHPHCGCYYTIVGGIEAIDGSDE
jgi:SPP1 gp7 family putative phage head morphogenesis protein